MQNDVTAQLVTALLAVQEHQVIAATAFPIVAALIFIGYALLTMRKKS